MSLSAGLDTEPFSALGDRVRAEDDDWLDRFHRGDAAVMESCYRDTFAAVESAVGSLLGPADRESIIHEVYSKLLGQPDFRRTFHGGSVSAWLAVVARNQAIDYGRRLRRETSLGAVPEVAPNVRRESEAAEARILIEKFRRDWLDPAWEPVFDACFVRQMSQREAARALGLSRTTVAYREVRIRQQLRQYLREEDRS